MRAVRLAAPGVVGALALVGALAAPAAAAEPGVTVQVRDDLGSVAGAQVLLTAVSGPEVVVSAVTDAAGRVTLAGTADPGALDPGELLLGESYDLLVTDGPTGAVDRWGYRDTVGIAIDSSTDDGHEVWLTAYQRPTEFGIDVDCTGPAITVTYWEDVPAGTGAQMDRGTVAMSAEPAAGDPWRAPDAAILDQLWAGWGRARLATYPAPGDGRVLQEGDEVVVGRRPVVGQEFRVTTRVRCPSAPDYATQRAAVADGYLFVAAAGRDAGLWVKARKASTNSWTGWARRGMVSGAPSTIGLAQEAGTTRPQLDWFVVSTTPYSSYQREPSVGYRPGWTWDYWGNLDEFYAASGVSLQGSRGDLFASALGADGQMWVIRVIPAHHDTSGPWVSRGRPAGVDLVGLPASAASDGKLFFATLGTDRGLWVQARSQTSASWSRWVGFGHPTGVDLIGAPGAVVSDGHLFLAALGEDGRVYTRSRNERTNAWSGWISRGRPPTSTLAGAPELVVSDGRMFLLLHGSDGRLWVRARDESSNAWTAWNDLGRPSDPLVSSVTGVRSDGKLFVLALDAGGDMVCRTRNESTNSWSGWVNLGSPGEGLAA